MYVEEFGDIVEAISREKQIKGWSRQKKKALIAGDFERLVTLSKSNPSQSQHYSMKLKDSCFDKLSMTE
jgi:putative endonuclease